MQRKSDKKHNTHHIHSTDTLYTQLLKKSTTFNNSRYTTNIPTDPWTVTSDIKAIMCNIHTSIVSQHLAARDNNKILRTHPPQVSSTEENLPRHTRRPLAQLRINKPPFLLSYLHKNPRFNTPITTLPPFVAFTNILHNISSVAHRYAPRCWPWICGEIPSA